MPSFVSIAKRIFAIVTAVQKLVDFARWCACETRCCEEQIRNDGRPAVTIWGAWNNPNNMLWRRRVSNGGQPSASYKYSRTSIIDAKTRAKPGVGNLMKMGRRVSWTTVFSRFG